MKKGIHPKQKMLKVTCGEFEFEILSTLKQDSINVDVSSYNHPFYIGSETQLSAKGRADKLSSRINSGKQTVSAPKTEKTTKVRVKKQKEAISLKDLSKAV